MPGFSNEVAGASIGFPYNPGTSACGSCAGRSAGSLARFPATKTGLCPMVLLRAVAVYKALLERISELLIPGNLLESSSMEHVGLVIKLCGWCPPLIVAEDHSDDDDKGPF